MCVSENDITRYENFDASEKPTNSDNSLDVKMNVQLGYFDNLLILHCTRAFHYRINSMV